jgi:hypothetical protein
VSDTVNDRDLTAAFASAQRKRWSTPRVILTEVDRWTKKSVYHDEIFTHNVDKGPS